MLTQGRGDSCLATCRGTMSIFSLRAQRESGQKEKCTWGRIPKTPRQKPSGQGQLVARRRVKVAHVFAPAFRAYASRALRGSSTRAVPRTHPAAAWQLTYRLHSPPCRRPRPPSLCASRKFTLGASAHTGAGGIPSPLPPARRANRRQSIIV